MADRVREWKAAGGPRVQGTRQESRHNATVLRICPKKEMLSLMNNN